MAPTKATLRDVAARARVSSTTASVVLTGRADEFRIAPETRDRIVAAAADLNYQSRGIRRRRREVRSSVLWSIFAASGVDVFPLRPFLDGVVGYLADEDLPISCAMVEFEPGRLHEKAPWFDREMLDGAIVIGTDDADLRFIETGAVPVPLVLYNRVAKGFPSVVVDELQVGRTAAAHFLAKGISDFVVVSTSTPTSAANMRMAGFSDALLGAGVSGPRGMPFERVEVRRDGAFRYEIAAERHAPIGMFVLSDEILPAVLDGLAAGGAAVPATVEVVTYGNSGRSATSTPPATTATIPMRAVGAECAEMLRHAVAHPGVLRDSRRVFQADLVFRESSPAPQSAP